MRVLLVVLLWFLTDTSCNQPFTEEMIASMVVSVSNQHFSEQLYEKLNSTEGNILVSPLSAQTILTMAYLGAEGKTLRQLEEGLGIPEDTTSKSFIKVGFRHLLENLKSTDKVTLDVANRLYLQEGFQIKETFQQTLESDFKAGIQQVDFANHTEGARTSINQWVDEKTHGKIQDLIAEGSLSSASVLVAVNALYFQGGWLKPFDEQDTSTAPFHVSSNVTVDVDMMHITDYFWYAHNRDVGVKAILLKYRGEHDYPNDEESQSLSMLILLPDEQTSLSSVESFVTAGNLPDLRRSADYKNVNLSLPRFKIEKTINLKNILQQIGIKKLFKPGADLSGITEGNIYVSKILQKTIVEVTEKGTEAAAATFAEAIPMSAIRLENFNVNRPFLFAIIDVRRNLFLFIGRVLNPRQLG